MSQGEQVGPGRYGTATSDLSLGALDGHWKELARRDRSGLCLLRWPWLLHKENWSGADKKEEPWSPQSGQRQMPPGEELGVSREMKDEKEVFTLQGKSLGYSTRAGKGVSRSEQASLRR